MINEQNLDRMITYLFNEYENVSDLQRRSSRFQGMRYAETNQFVLPEKPWTIREKIHLWRGLVNRREPHPIDPNYITWEDAFLTEYFSMQSIVRLEQLQKKNAPLYVWQGDITRLNVDVIVNAANNDMLGCFIPNHQCVDNQIHTFAGVRLRLDLNDQMQQQGHKEPVGRARLTPGYQLPTSYIIHTVGPMITGDVNPIKKQQLKKSYQSCLQLATEVGLSTIAFSGISTGQFGYPNKAAAQVAYQTVQDFLQTHQSTLQVVFCTHTPEDEAIYHRLLEEGRDDKVATH